MLCPGASAFEPVALGVSVIAEQKRVDFKATYSQLALWVLQHVHNTLQGLYLSLEVMVFGSTAGVLIVYVWSLHRVVIAKWSVSDHYSASIRETFWKLRNFRRRLGNLWPTGV